MRMRLKSNILLAIMSLNPMLMHADVLFNGRKPIAVGKGERDKTTIHWTYCDGKKRDFTRPPHDFTTGEHCEIQPDIFGVKKEHGRYFVEDPLKFRKFFAGAKKGDELKFSVAEDSIQMDYKGKAVTIYRLANHKSDNHSDHNKTDQPR